MSDEATKKPKLEVVPEEVLDADEAEFKKLRRDLPGIKGASAAGIVAVNVGKLPGKNEFFRTHPEFRPVVPLVDHEVGLEKQFFAVKCNKVGLYSRVADKILPTERPVDRFAIELWGSQKRGSSQATGPALLTGWFPAVSYSELSPNNAISAVAADQVLALKNVLARRFRLNRSNFDTIAKILPFNAFPSKSTVDALRRLDFVEQKTFDVHLVAAKYRLDDLIGRFCALDRLHLLGL